MNQSAVLNCRILEVLAELAKLKHCLDSTDLSLLEVNFRLVGELA